MIDDTLQARWRQCGQVMVDETMLYQIDENQEVKRLRKMVTQRGLVIRSVLFGDASTVVMYCLDKFMLTLDIVVMPTLRSYPKTGWII